MPRTDPIPPPLGVSASLAFLQGVVLLGVAALELASIDAERVSLGVTVGIFFGIYAVLLLLAAWALSKGDSWARGPILLTQLIELGVAFTLRQDLPVVLVVGLAVVAVVAILGIIHPSSVARLARD